MRLNRRINLHTHSEYSDGKQTIQSIIKSAINANLEYIAITDHFSNSRKAKIIATLNNMEKIENYLSEIEACNSQLKEKSLNLVALKGIEIDLGSSDTYISSLIKPQDFDLILFEYLETLESIAFLKNIIHNWKGLLNGKQLPLLGLAHFDPSFFIYGNLDLLFSFISNFNIFFEFNSSYPEYYSTRNALFFEKIRERNVLVSIGCDTHSILNIGDIEDPFIAIENYSLKKNYFEFIAELDKRFK